MKKLIFIVGDDRHMGKTIFETLDSLYIEEAVSREMIGVMSIIAHPSYTLPDMACSPLDVPGHSRRRRWRDETKYFGRGCKR